MEKVDSKNIDRENKHDDAVASMAAGLEAVKHYVAEKKENDKVNNPSHYTYGQWEVIDILRGMLTPEQLEGFLLGNVLKYVFRYSHKNGSEDLRKADVYLGWLAELVKSWEDEEAKENAAEIGEEEPETEDDTKKYTFFDPKNGTVLEFHLQAITEKGENGSVMTGDPIHGYTIHKEDTKE